ncbi:MAG: hypothetical protein ABSH19_04630 [Opitutales bacterium]|jgi:hypothetical protein
MKTTAWFLKEAKAFGVRTVYFLFCYGILLLIKKLILEEYHIGFFGFGNVIIGALISAKVVLVVEHTPLARTFGDSRPIVKVLFETVFYGLVSLATLYTERAFELRHQAGGFFPAYSIVLHQNDRYLFAVTLLAVTLSFSFYSVLNVIDQHLGQGELLKLFFRPRNVNRSH